MNSGFEEAQICAISHSVLLATLKDSVGGPSTVELSELKISSYF